MTDKVKEIEYLVLIVSPFQYLCVLEYLHEYNIPKKKCGLITVTGRRVAYDHIVNIGKTKQFAFFEAPFVESRGYQGQAMKLAFELKGFLQQQLIVGNIQDVWCHAMVQHNRHNNVPTVLDDGTGSIPQINRMLNGVLTVKRKWNIREFIPKLFFRPKSRITKEIKFYTIFKEFGNRDKNVVINTFSYAKQKYGISEKKLANEVWFIGGPYVDKDMISYDDYENILHMAQNFAKDNNCTFKYFKHRLEKSIPIQNDNLVENPVPFEVFYFKSGQRPKYVIGLYSTCLTVLGVLNTPTKVISLEIDPSIRKKGNWPVIDDVYTHLKNRTSVLVKNLNELSM